MWLIFGKKDIGSWWMMVVLIVVVMFSVFLCAEVDGVDEFDRYPAVIRFEGTTCKLKAGDTGICKSIAKCESYFTTPYSDFVRCSFNRTMEIVCCPLNNSPQGTMPRAGISTEGPFQRRTTSTANERPSVRACNEWKSLDTSAVSTHVLNAEQALAGTFPHMGALIIRLTESPTDHSIHCLSFLISEQFVLTAAHCVSHQNKESLFVRLGMLNWDSHDTDRLDAEIEAIIIHPNYSPSAKIHDIAILKLKKAVKFTRFIIPACLHADEEDLKPNTTLGVIGWGVTNVTTGTILDSLLKANLITVPLNMCTEKFRRRRAKLRSRSQLTKGHYCAIDGQHGGDACNLDSGGPLQFYPNGGRVAEIVGIVMPGESCGTATPSLYSRIPFYLNWIESHVWP